MALASEAAANMLSKEERRLSIREDLNIHFQGLVLEDRDDDGLDDIDEEYIQDPETAEMATMERQWLKNRKSLTKMNQLATLKLSTKGSNGSNGHDLNFSDDDDDASGTARPLPQPTKANFLAAKKSIEDMSAWINDGLPSDDDDA